MTHASILMTPNPAVGGAPTTVAAMEALLEQWFARPVVLTSSGRGAILLLLEAWGLSRYRDRIAMPRFISACVMEAVIRRAFPADVSQDPSPEVALLYHQYGFPQHKPRGGRSLEDICHAFYATPETGARDWQGEAAVFSLPKFFATGAMVGGIVAPDPQTARALRQRRDAVQHKHLFTVQRMSEVFRAHYHSGGGGLEELYTARLTDPRISDAELTGLPVSMEDLKAIGARRQAVIRALLQATGGRGLPADWVLLLRDGLPFLFPVAGSAGALAKARDMLIARGAAADIYRIDMARNMYAPKYENLLLVPCHHEITSDQLRAMTDILNAMEP